MFFTFRFFICVGGAADDEVFFLAFRRVSHYQHLSACSGVWLAFKVASDSRCGSVKLYWKQKPKNKEIVADEKQKTDVDDDRHRHGRRLLTAKADRQARHCTYGGHLFCKFPMQPELDACNVPFSFEAMLYLKQT